MFEDNKESPLMPRDSPILVDLTTTETPNTLSEENITSTQFNSSSPAASNLSPKLTLASSENETISKICSSTDNLKEDSNSWLTTNNFIIHKPFYNISKQRKEVQRLGMKVTTKSVVLQKDETNLLGISIGGGAPLCPCLYIVQIFDGTPAALDKNLESGDELLAINNIKVKGKTKVQVAKMIQNATGKVTLHFNKLHADPQRGKSLDIILKKFKHRLVDNMSSNTADNLGLSRAILCNDSLVKRLEELNGTEVMYKGLVEHAGRVLKAYNSVLQSYRDFGDCFMEISTRESQQRASEAFRLFGEFHRNLEKEGVQVLEQIRPILDEVNTYLTKAIPDTKLTINRYMDAKFTYLSYCLKIKEMDDEEQNFANIQEALYRVETGNYEYRLILRCRQDARLKFAKLRTDVLEKIELLECKHVNDLAAQLESFLVILKRLNQLVLNRLGDLPQLFPIEVDYKDTDFQYKSQTLEPQSFDENEDCLNNVKEKYYKETITSAVEAIEEEMAASIISVPKRKDEDLLGKNMSALNLNDKTCTLNSNMEFILPGDSNSHTFNTKDTENFDLFLNQGPEQISQKYNSFQTEKDAMANNALETDLILQ